MVADLERFGASLATPRLSTKRRVVGLSSCRPIAKDARRTVRCHAACCRDVNGRSAHIEVLAYMPSDRATSRTRAAKQRAVQRALLETRRQDDSATTRRLAHFASDKTKRR
jgi:hypothetical protein